MSVTHEQETEADREWARGDATSLALELFDFDYGLVINDRYVYPRFLWKEYLMEVCHESRVCELLWIREYGGFSPYTHRLMIRVADRNGWMTDREYLVYKGE